MKPEANYQLVAYDWNKSHTCGTPRIVVAVDNPAIAAHWFASTYADAIKRGEYEIREASGGKFTRVNFYCVDCGHLASVEYQESGGSGYAYLPDGSGRLCYDHAAQREIDRAKQTGKAFFYLFWEGGKPVAVGDWSGTLKMSITNYLASNDKLIVWFKLEGVEWRGINNGSDDLVRAGKKWRI